MTGIVGRAAKAAVIADLQMSAQRGGPTLLQRVHDSALLWGQHVLSTIHRPVLAQHVRDLQLGSLQARRPLHRLHLPGPPRSRGRVLSQPVQRTAGTRDVLGADVRVAGGGPDGAVAQQHLERA